MHYTVCAVSVSFTLGWHFFHCDSGNTSILWNVNECHMKKSLICKKKIKHTYVLILFYMSFVNGSKRLMRDYLQHGLRMVKNYALVHRQHCQPYTVYWPIVFIREFEFMALTFWGDVIPCVLALRVHTAYGYVADKGKILIEKQTSKVLR